MDSIALLKTLLERAETERDQAAGVLRQAEALEARARDQAEQLTSYRQEFDQRWTLRFRQAGSRELLDCRQAFGERLAQAITGQTGSLQQASQRVGLARQALLQREQRVAAVRKLIERREAELLRLAGRREQRADDESALRQHLRRAATAP